MSNPRMTSVAAHLKIVKAGIATAAKTAKRDPANIRLVAVSKTQPVEAIEAALEAGQMCFGENRVQEAKAKFGSLRERFPSLELHLIGPLQTNKVDEAVRLFDVIQTVDRPRLAAALAQAMKKLGKIPRLYVEVNIGNEPQKAGVLPDDLKVFLRQCRESFDIKIEGLMCIPPYDDNPEPYFRTLKNLADANNLPRLSMGMSGDYETAIRCGATDVRVGTAIFGERKAR